MSHLVETPVRAILDNLEGNVGPVADSWKIQGTNADGDTPLGALTFEVRNSKLVATVRGVEVVKRVRVGDGGNLYSDCEKKNELEKRSVGVSWTNQSSAGEQW